MTIVRFVCSAVCVIGLAAFLTACGNTKTYSTIDPGSESARPQSRLALPPDLIDSTSDTLIANQAETESQSQRVLPEQEGLDMERNDKEGWVEVGYPAEQVWQKLIAHWAALGVDLVVNDPTTGIMETDWVEPAGSESKENQSLTDTLMRQLLGTVLGGPTSLDKYTIELERLAEARTRIHVSHRGRKKIQTRRGNIANNAQYEWVETEEDLSKIKRALSSIQYGLQSSST